MNTNLPTTETIDKLFLELSQFTQAKTKSHLDLEERCKRLENRCKQYRELLSDILTAKNTRLDRELVERIMEELGNTYENQVY